MLYSAVLGVPFYRPSAGRDFLVLSFGDCVFVLFCHDVMPTLGCRDCKECVEDHLLFIRVFVSSFSRQRISVPVHVCSTSPGKEMSGSLCQGVALLCGT